MRLKAYYRLTKPGIIYGNLLTAIAGFLLASRWHIELRLFLATLIGTSLVIAGACIYNNCLDRNIDKKMARTRRRALVTGEISLASALSLATVLTLVGFGLLAIWVNRLVVLIGLIGFIDYVVLYGLAKRRSVYSTLVGSISGSAPIVAGYCAVTDHFGLAALFLFLILTFWQMPHFYAIAMYRRKDYGSAGLPVLPLKREAAVVKFRIMAYIVGFLVVCILLAAKHYAGRLYVISMILLGLGWLWVGLKNYQDIDNECWGKRMFRFSLIVILGLSVALSLDALLRYN